MLDINELLDNLEIELKNTITTRQLNDPLIIGIRTGGVWISEVMHSRLAIQEPLGLLDISFYRDDFSQIGMHPNVKPSFLPTNLEGRDIILIDDVFYTGRTIRAALNEIFDYGRPHQIILGVLIERNGKQIPITPDCIGTHLILNADEWINIQSSPLAISIEAAG